MSVQIISSSDGSHTLVSESLGVSYHSHHGAIQESEVVFIQAGLQYLHQQGKNDIRIFELGFGTGLNCLLSHNYVSDRVLKVDYTGIDTYPLPEDVSKKLNYGEQLNCLSAFETVSGSTWGIRHYLSPKFSLLKIELSFQEFTTEETYHLMYMDAFGPATQPELWDEYSTEKMFDLLEPDGVLVTYCAQGQFKRNLKGAGFRIEALPGPPGKREMVRAFKN